MSRILEAWNTANFGGDTRGACLKRRGGVSRTTQKRQNVSTSKCFPRIFGHPRGQKATKCIISRVRQATKGGKSRPQERKGQHTGRDRPAEGRKMRAKRGNFAAQFVHSKSTPREKFDRFRKLFAHRREIPRHQMLPRMPLPAQEEDRRSGPISHAKAPQGIGVPKGAIGLQNKGLNTRKRDLAREWLNAFGQKRGPFTLFRPFALIRPFALFRHFTSFRPFALFHLFIAHSINKRLSCGYIR